jgi:hypothetical protein
MRLAARGGFPLFDNRVSTIFRYARDLGSRKSADVVSEEALWEIERRLRMSSSASASASASELLKAGHEVRHSTYLKHPYSS